MLSFLGNFTASFRVALVMWPFAALVLTLPLLLVHYIRFRRVAFGRVVMTYLVVLYGLALAAFTLYPMPDNAARFCGSHHIQPQLTPLASILEIPHEGVRALLQVVLNVIFFVPLGAFLRAMYRVRWWTVVAIGLITSVVIELTQLTGVFGVYPCSYRLFDVDDLLLNTSGALLGFWSGWLLPNLRDTERGATTILRPGLVRRIVAFVVDMTGVAIGSTIVMVALTLFNVLHSRQWTEQMQMLTQIVPYGFIALVHAILPLAAQGRTLGGWLTGISLDDRPRGWFHRVVFYAVRLLYIAVLSMVHLPFVSLMTLLVTIVLWYRYKQLPYAVLDRYWPTRHTPTTDDE